MSPAILFVIVFAALLAFYFYCRVALKLSIRQTVGRVFDFLAAFYQAAQSATSWDQLVLIAYQTWLTHSYPAGRPLMDPKPTLEQIEQAGLLLKSLVASELDRADLPEKIRRGHQEILKIDALDLGYAVRDLILDQWGGGDGTPGD